MINTMIVKPLKYGVQNDAGMLGKMEDCVLKASTVFPAQSGQFVVPDGTDDFDLAASGDTVMAGWAVTHAHTVSASVVEKANIITDINARFVMPADASVTNALKGMQCDIIVNATIQQADIGESTEDVLIIYDTCAALQLVEVGINPAKQFTTGVV